MNPELIADVCMVADAFGDVWPPLPDCDADDDNSDKWALLAIALPSS